MSRTEDGIRKRDGNQAAAVLKGPPGDHGDALRYGVAGQDRRVLLVVILIFLIVIVIGGEPGAVGPEQGLFPTLNLINRVPARLDGAARGDAQLLGMLPEIIIAAEAVKAGLPQLPQTGGQGDQVDGAVLERTVPNLLQSFAEQDAAQAFAVVKGRVSDDAEVFAKFYPPQRGTIREGVLSDFSQGGGEGHIRQAGPPGEGVGPDPLHALRNLADARAKEGAKGSAAGGEHKGDLRLEMDVLRVDSDFRKGLGMVVPSVLQVIGPEETAGVQGLQPLADVDPFQGRVLEGFFRRAVTPSGILTSRRPIQPLKVVLMSLVMALER